LFEIRDNVVFWISKLLNLEKTSNRLYLSSLSSKFNTARCNPFHGGAMRAFFSAPPSSSLGILFVRSVVVSADFDGGDGHGC
jgi:hypothetical protein